MEFDIFLYVGIVFAAAYLAKALTNRFRMPEVTGYVIVGVVLGASLAGVLGTDQLDTLEPLSSVGLALIAFIIGSELRWTSLRRLGASIPLIVVFEGLGAFTLVALAMHLIMGVSLELSLLLGAVAACFVSSYSYR